MESNCKKIARNRGPFRVLAVGYGELVQDGLSREIAAVSTSSEMHVYVCMYIYIYVCIYIYIYEHLSLFYVCIYIYVYAYID